MKLVPNPEYEQARFEITLIDATGKSVMPPGAWALRTNSEEIGLAILQGKLDGRTHSIPPVIAVPE
jgi:hypothetical protein